MEEAAAGRVNGKWLMLIKRTREQRWVNRGDDRKVRALGQKAEVQRARERCRQRRCSE